MAKAMSEDLRKRVVEQAEKGMSIKKIRKTFKVSRATAYRWIKKKRETGSVKAIEPARPGNNHRVLPEEYGEFKEMVNNNRGKNAIDMCALWKRLISPTTMRSYLKKLGFTFKKNNFYIPSAMKMREEYSKKQLQP